MLLEEYRDAYRKRRAEHPVLVFAHNNARFDSLLMLDFLAQTGRLRVPRSTLEDEYGFDVPGAAENKYLVKADGSVATDDTPQARARAHSHRHLSRIGSRICSHI